MQLYYASTIGADQFVGYLKNSFPQLLTVGPIVSALMKHGKFKYEEVKKALLFGTGPRVKIGPMQLRLFNTQVDVAENTITVSWYLYNEYERFRPQWDLRTTAAQREEFAAELDKKITREPFHPHTAFFTDHDIVFLTTKSGKRVWALGAILLESLVRLGAGRTMAPDKAMKQSVRFEEEVYGRAMVDSAANRLGVAYHIMKKGDAGPHFQRMVNILEK